VLDVSFTQNNTNTPQSGYTQMVYGDGTKLIGYSALNVGHTVPVHETADLAWFGISGSTGTTTSSSVTGSSPTTSTAPTTTSSTGSSGGSIPKWGQW
jgi:acetylxylan esterase